MKSTKMFVSILVAALALVALVGAGSASATTICRTSGTPSAFCPAGALGYASDAPFTATSSNLVLESANYNLYCPSASMTVDPETSSGEPVKGQVTAMSYGPGCHFSNAAETACTFTATNLPYGASIYGGINGANVSALMISGNPGFQIKCGALLNCKFSYPVLEVIGENTSQNLALRLVKHRIQTEGGLCPVEAHITATYTATGVNIV